MTKPIDIGTRIGFDFGEKRIGVATSDSESRHLSGENSPKSVQAIDFAKLIQSIFSGPIYLIDERLSTANAYSQMREAGKNSKESKAVIDQIAAVNILESAILNEKSGTSIGEIF